MASPTSNSPPSSPCTPDVSLLEMEESGLSITAAHTNPAQNIETMLLGDWRLEKIGNKNAQLSVDLIIKSHVKQADESESGIETTVLDAEITVKERSSKELRLELTHDKIQCFNTDPNNSELEVSNIEEIEADEALLVENVLINCRVTDISASSLQLESEDRLEGSLIEAYTQSATEPSSSVQPQPRKVTVKFSKTFTSEIIAQPTVGMLSPTVPADGFNPREMREVPQSTPTKAGVKRKLEPEFN